MNACCCESRKFHSCMVCDRDEAPLIESSVACGNRSCVGRQHNMTLGIISTCGAHTRWGAGRSTRRSRRCRMDCVRSTRLLCLFSFAANWMLLSSQAMTAHANDGGTDVTALCAPTMVDDSPKRTVGGIACCSTTAVGGIENGEAPWERDYLLELVGAGPNGKCVCEGDPSNPIEVRQNDLA